MRAVLLHRSEEEGAEGLNLLRAAGWDGKLWTLVTPAVIREWAAEAPDAILIDLSRRPSHGKEVAMACRERKGLRTTPLVFLEGAAEPVEALRGQHADAVFSDWKHIRSALKLALARKGTIPDRAPAHRAAETPLAKKLGLVAGVRGVALGAPAEFEAALGALPEGASLERDTGGPAGVVVRFARTRADLLDGFEEAVRALASRGKLWVAYPKQSSGLASDLTQAFVREYALTRGWVDYKVCAIDSRWTGFCFSKKKG
jgi:CheY-like chemotaxis protein